MNLEQLNETSVRIDNILNNDRIPIGGSMFGTMNLHLTIDGDKFKNFFTSVNTASQKLAVQENFQHWVAKYTPEFDAITFAQLYCFDNKLRSVYPNMSKNIKNRNTVYEPDKTQTLSESFNAGICACAEIALLAQIYFQGHGIKTKYFSGELLTKFKDDDDFAEKHSFIILSNKDQDYIYDPANPIFANGCYFPRIQTTEKNQILQFENRIKDNTKRQCTFIETTNLLNKQKLFYGVGDGAIVFKQNIIRQSTPIITKEQEY